MLDDKLIKFLALQRIHQLFPSRVQTSPGSVGAHPLTSGGHHTEGAHAHLPPYHTIRSPLCVNGHLPSVEDLSFQYLNPPCVSLMGLIKHHSFFSQKIETKWHLQLSAQIQGNRL